LKNIIAAVLIITTVLFAIAAWIQHLIWTIGILVADPSAPIGKIVLGVLGVFVPVIGSIHGGLIWMGVSG
jgi:hypothetical protein